MTTYVLRPVLEQYFTSYDDKESLEKIAAAQRFVEDEIGGKGRAVSTQGALTGMITLPVPCAPSTHTHTHPLCSVASQAARA